MAKSKMTIKAGEDYMRRLSQLGEGSAAIAKKAVYEASGIVADRIRKNLVDNINDPQSAAKSGRATFKKDGEERTGDLVRSLGITPIKLDKNGILNVKIGFDGYDSRGVPNQLKARVMESGSSTIEPRPFVKPAVKATKKAAEEAMNRVINEEIEKIMKG